ncbi:hypothetical protein Pcac1_g3549 [Phytophthora cactorum]|nr:hypothetical protein Pcac1_g3549 [Phytophthora cactorum]KAG2993031.1 hypothetical protein PC119_g18563 [Phytophthora cactorum]
MLLSHETGWRSFFFSIHVVVLVRHRFLLQSIVTILAVLTSVLVKPATQGASKPMLAVTVLALYAAVRSRRLPVRCCLADAVGARAKGRHDGRVVVGLNRLGPLMSGLIGLR